MSAGQSSRYYLFVFRLGCCWLADGTPVRLRRGIGQFYFGARRYLIGSSRQSELRKETRNVQSQSFELLQQSKYDQGRIRGETAHAALPIPIALLDNNYFINVAEWSSDCAEHGSRSLNDAGQFLENGLKPCRLVELFPGFGFFQNGSSFGQSLSFDGFCLSQSDGLDLRGFGAAFGLNRGGPADAFFSQSLLVRFCDCNQGCALAFRFENDRLLGCFGFKHGRGACGVGRFDYCCFEFLFST